MFLDNLKKACFNKGTSPSAVLRALGMSTSSVTAWGRGINPSVGTVYRIAQHLEVDPAELMEGWTTERLDDYNAGYVDSMETDWEKEKAPTLTKKDERDIARRLEAIMVEMSQSAALMFDGNPMTDEAKDTIMSAMKLGLEAAKAKNKERFTPKKYKKE